MIINKYLGKTEEEAEEPAKKELGSGIVIMNVKTVKPKGLKALLRPKMVEVTVALEEESDVKRPTSREGIPASAGIPSAARTVLQGGRPVSGGGSALRPAEDSMEDRASIEKKLDNLQNLLVSRFQQSELERREQLAG